LPELEAPFNMITEPGMSLWGWLEKLAC
jgi:hypothetical protein